MKPWLMAAALLALLVPVFADSDYKKAMADGDIHYDRHESAEAQACDEQAVKLDPKSAD